MTNSKWKLLILNPSIQRQLQMNKIYLMLIIVISNFCDIIFTNSIYHSDEAIQKGLSLH